MSNLYMWEFPFGKVEKGKEINNALKSEIEEELNCKRAKEDGIYHEHTHEYESVIINLVSIKYKVINGTPTPNEHSKLIWLKKDKMATLKWAPADIPAVKQLIKEK